MIRRLDLIRHGHALPASPTGDAGRELSPEGLEAVRTLARRLAATGWRPDVLFTSPLIRARQTTSLLVSELRSGISTEVLDELDPDSTTTSTLAALEAAANDRWHVAAVGHQPLIGSLIERLTGETSVVAPGSFHVIEFGAESGRTWPRLV